MAYTAHVLEVHNGRQALLRRAFGTGRAASSSKTDKDTSGAWQGFRNIRFSPWTLKELLEFSTIKGQVCF